MISFFELSGDAGGPSQDFQIREDDLELPHAEWARPVLDAPDC